MEINYMKKKKPTQKRNYNRNSSRNNSRKPKRKTRTKAKRKQQILKRILLFLLLLLVTISAIKHFKPSLLTRHYFERKGTEIDAKKPEIDVELLTVNPYSRPGTKTDKIKGIVIHYTANPGASALDNRNYFENLKDTHETKTSSNFIVGLNGEIVQCVPTWEVAYASNSRNNDTVSIECCHPDETGKFTDETYRSAAQLCAWLCLKFDLDEKDIIRHYDVTGKNCPKYYVENEEAWKQFKLDIKNALK